MELVNEFVNNQFALYIPVALVLVGAILVFAFGFKSAEQPPFDKLSSISSEDRKTPGKKRKLKEKKAVINGNVINVGENKGDKSPSKESKRKEQESTKKSDNVVKSNVDKKKTEPFKSKLVEEKNKRNTKTKVTEKPLDFDDGSWETVPAKGDKKKKQDSPIKKEKKNNNNKKSDKALEIDKLVKDVVNKELQEKEKLRDSPIPVIKETEVKEAEVAEVVTEVSVEFVEVKKDKKAEKKSKKSDIEKIENNQNEQIAVDTVEIPTPPEVKPEETPAPVKSSSGSVAFDELGDVWTEAKQPKKSKKKSRRDN